MSRLIDREVVLNIGGLRIASRAIQGEALPILRVQFKVVRALRKDPNTADIVVYNLNKTNRSAMQEKNIPTTIEGGYRDNVSQVFGGVLQFGGTVKNGEDWVTTIQSSDGGQKYKSARINVGFKGPVTIEKVLETAGEALGINLGNLKEKVREGGLRSALKEFTNGKVLSGKAEQIFTKIAKSAGYSWSVQDGQIQLLGPKEVIDERAVVLSSIDGRSTGLVGSPEPGEKGFVKVRALLQPNLLPGRKVQVQSREVDGFYRIEKGVYTGDTWGGDWYADLEVKPL